MLYSIYIKVGNTALKLPINPDEVKFKYSVGINKYNIISLGEIAEFNSNKLTETQIRSFIPRINTNLITNSTIRAREFVNEINDARENGEVVELVIKREALDNIAMDCYITNLNVIEKGGEKNDIYYEISFTEWKPHEPKIVDIQQPAPIQIKLPINESPPQQQINRDTKEVRVQEEERPKVTSQIIRGDLVIVNGTTYSMGVNNKGKSLAFIEMKLNNHKTVIIDVDKKNRDYPYRFKSDRKIQGTLLDAYAPIECLTKLGGKS